MYWFNILSVILILLTPAAGFAQAWDKGFNFRSTSAYVTDGANETYVIGDVYPTTRNGVTFGWVGAVDWTANRSTSVDRRVAGVQGVWGLSGTYFRVDLPASGDFDLEVAMGDQGQGNGPADWSIQDTTTNLETVDNGNFPAAGVFRDANNVQHSTAANWAANQTAKRYTFATTQLRVVMGFNNAQITAIAHLRVVQVGGGAPTSRQRTLTGVGQ
jgi:hypothetical protein